LTIIAQKKKKKFLSQEFSEVKNQRGNKKLP
jgi:hypothetical protein